VLHFYQEAIGKKKILVYNCEFLIDITLVVFILSNTMQVPDNYVGIK